MTPYLILHIALSFLNLAPVLSELGAEESAVILGVGSDYGLEGESLKLLLVIRVIENGGRGIEFGVVNPAARRYASDCDSRRSLRLQAKWCSGSIRKRFTGNLAAFRDRWCPPSGNGYNGNWLRNATYWMGRKL